MSNTKSSTESAGAAGNFNANLTVALGVIRFAKYMSYVNPSASLANPSPRSAVIALVALTLLGAGAAAGPAGAASPTRCTIVGTAGSDVLKGTSGSDVICGLGGNDVILAGGGNDVINAGSGNDRVSGGSGADVINGEAGNDVIDADDGDDRIIAGDGVDIADGGRGNDVISGDAGNDSVSGGTGNDVLKGGVGSDQVSGDQGNDVLSGDSGDDTANGDSGSDTINGGIGNDVLNGGVDNDQVAGGIGDDALRGGAGTDQIYAGTGADTCASDSADRVSGACSIDKTGPAAAWVNVPSTVTAGESFTATFSLKDPSSIDPNSPNVKIGGAPGWITTWCGDAGSFPLMATRVSGTNADGVWSVTCKVPAKAVNNTYSLFIDSQDSFGNSSDSPSADFTVVGGSSDSGPPLISDVVIPTSVKPGETITLTWRASDPSGVKDTPYPWAYRPAPQFGVIYGDGVEAPVRTSGTAFDGAYSQTLTVPVNSVKGIYPVYISAGDELGNKTYQQYGSFTVS